MAKDQKKAEQKAEAAGGETKTVQGRPIRKITTATVFGKVTAEILGEIIALKGEPYWMMEVYGIASRAKPGASDFGPFVKFIGQFRARNAKTGEMFTSASLLLPKYLEEELAGALGVAEGSGGTNAEFAVKIGATLDETSATKYVYIHESLVEPQESNAMLSLENRIRQHTNLLAAPKK